MSQKLPHLNFPIEEELKSPLIGKYSCTLQKINTSWKLFLNITTLLQTKNTNFTAKNPTCLAWTIQELD